MVASPEVDLERIVIGEVLEFNTSLFAQVARVMFLREVGEERCLVVEAAATELAIWVSLRPVAVALLQMVVVLLLRIHLIVQKSDDGNSVRHIRITGNDDDNLLLRREHLLVIKAVVAQIQIVVRLVVGLEALQVPLYGVANLALELEETLNVLAVVVLREENLRLFFECVLRASIITPYFEVAQKLQLLRARRVTYRAVREHLG